MATLFTFIDSRITDFPMMWAKIFDFGRRNSFFEININDNTLFEKSNFCPKIQF